MVARPGEQLDKHYPGFGRVTGINPKKGYVRVGRDPTTTRNSRASWAKRSSVAPMDKPDGGGALGGLVARDDVAVLVEQDRTPCAIVAQTAQLPTAPQSMCMFETPQSCDGYTFGFCAVDAFMFASVVRAVFRPGQGFGA
jgi:hypothetical protein